MGNGTVHAPQKRLRFLWYLGEIAFCLLLQVIPLVSQGLSSQGWNIVYFLSLYVLYPLCAALIPWFLTRRRGVSAIFTFFPFGLSLLLFPFYPNGKLMGLICLLIGMFSASLAQTMNEKASSPHKKKVHHRRP